MTWAGFFAVLVAFFLTHSLPLRPAVRARLVALFGPRRFSLGYSLLSLAMLAALIAAAGRAPVVVLWPQMGWQVALVQAGMLAVCLLLGLSLGQPNPFSFGGARNDRFDPARPGIVRLTRHPVLLALALWAGLHLLPNGDLAHVVLFGVLGGFALLGRALVDRRSRRSLGPDLWHRLRAETAAAPLSARPGDPAAVALRIAAGLAGYGALVLLHPVVLGVAVF